MEKVTCDWATATEADKKQFPHKKVEVISKAGQPYLFEKPNKHTIARAI